MTKIHGTYPMFRWESPSGDLDVDVYDTGRSITITARLSTGQHCLEERVHLPREAAQFVLDTLAKQFGAFVGAQQEVSRV